MLSKQNIISSITLHELIRKTLTSSKNYLEHATSILYCSQFKVDVKFSENFTYESIVLKYKREWI